MHIYTKAQKHKSAFTQILILGESMQLNNDARAILYVIGTNTGTPTIAEVHAAIKLSEHLTAFIVEQMKCHDLVIEYAGRLTLSRNGLTLFNDLS